MALRLWSLSRGSARAVGTLASPSAFVRRSHSGAHAHHSTAGVGGGAAKLLAGAAAAYAVFTIVKNRGAKPVLLRAEGEPKPRLVVLGSGWGALSLLKELELANYDVTIVSPTNYFLFTPLLPSATVGTVQAASLTEPLRKYCTRVGKDGKSHSAKFYEATCTTVDPLTKTIQCKDTSALVGAVSEFSLEYDLLVMAVGATCNTFGTPGVAEHCFMVKTVPDARRIRDRILDNFETASLPGQPEEERRRLLSFVVVGGGPTGVEFAAELKDYIEEDLMGLYREVAPLATVKLVQSNAHLLNTYSKRISEITKASFEKQHIDTVVNSRVVEVTADSVRVLDKETGEVHTVPCGMCVWSTGVGQTPLAKSLAAQLEQQHNRRALVTDGSLRLLGAPEIFAIGDCGTVSQEKLIDKFVALFKEGDLDGDQELSLDEFKGLAEHIALTYPQMRCYLGSLDALFAKHDANHDGVLSLEEFGALLREADNGLTALPATAQVAGQQGAYVAQLLNHDMLKEPSLAGVAPFQYRHMGSLAYVGGSEAVMDLDKMQFGGFVAWMMWRSAYFQMQHSLGNQVSLFKDWAHSWLFGRNLTRD